MLQHTGTPAVSSSRTPCRRAIAWSTAVIFTVAALLSLPGCRLFRSNDDGNQDKFGSVDLAGALDPLEWQADLIMFLNKIYSRVIGMASTIAANTEDRTIREVSLRWKVNISDLVVHVMREPDLRRAGLFTWVALVQDRQRLVTGLEDEGGRFGKQQEYALSVIRGLEQDFLVLARKHFGEDAVLNVQDDVEEVARKYPVTIHMARSWEPINAATEEVAKSNDVMGILKAPFAPISGLQGVGDTPTAINKFTDVADGAVELLRRLPERTRWELELLLLELGDLGPLKELSDDMDRFLETFDAVSKTAAGLPKELRSELEVYLEKVKEVQPDLRTTLEKAEDAAKAFTEAGETTRDVSSDLNTTGEKLTQMAEAWEATAKAVNEVLLAYGKLAEEPPEEEAAEEEESPTVEDYTELARSFNRAATEIRALLADINEPFGDEAGIDQTVAKAEAGVQAIVNALTVRGLILLGVGFLLALVYHRITRRKAPS